MTFGLSPMLTDQQIADVRARFPILEEKTYLYNCSQGALSDAVEAGMERYMGSWRTAAAPWDEWWGKSRRCGRPRSVHQRRT